MLPAAAVVDVGSCCGSSRRLGFPLVEALGPFLVLVDLDNLEGATGQLEQTAEPGPLGLFILTIVNSWCWQGGLVAVAGLFPGLVGGRRGHGGFRGGLGPHVLVRRGITVSVVVQPLVLDPVFLNAGIGRVVVDLVGPSGAGRGERRGAGARVAASSGGTTFPSNLASSSPQFSSSPT